MTTHYKLKSINAQFSESGIRVTYGVEIFRDDTGRYIGQEGHIVTSQDYLALILQAAQGAIPLMDAQVGMPGGLPTATSEGTTATPVPTPPATN